MSSNQQKTASSSRPSAEEVRKQDQTAYLQQISQRASAPNIAAAHQAGWDAAIRFAQERQAEALNTAQRQHETELQTLRKENERLQGRYLALSQRLAGRSALDSGLPAEDFVASSEALEEKASSHPGEIIVGSYRSDGTVDLAASKLPEGTKLYVRVSELKAAPDKAISPTEAPPVKLRAPSHERLILPYQGEMICVVPEDYAWTVFEEYKRLRDLPSQSTALIGELRNLVMRAHCILSIREAAFGTHKGAAWLEAAARVLNGTGARPLAQPSSEPERDRHSAPSGETCYPLSVAWFEEICPQCRRENGNCDVALRGELERLRKILKDIARGAWADARELRLMAALGLGKEGQEEEASIRRLMRLD